MRICNQWVAGSTPVTSSKKSYDIPLKSGVCRGAFAFMSPTASPLFRKIMPPGGVRVLRSAHHDAAVVFGGVKYDKRNRPRGDDMYPQFWTPRIGGIFMKYSYEYKKNCIELYRQGKWPETPDGIKQENFRISVRRWSRREKSCGAESLQKNQKKMWSADEKYELIAKVLAGVSITESAISAGVEPSLLSQWVRCYKMKGYQGLAAQRKGRPPKEPDMKKKIVPAELTPSEREELIRLRAENEYLRTENEVIKKRIALRQEKFAAQLKAKKLHSSTNSEEKDTL